MSVEFRLIERGYKKTLVLIPGWATDYRIFSGLDLGYNYLLPLETFSFTTIEGLLAALEKESIDKVSLLGWSMGGFQATDFALKHPLRVEKLILLSIREQYDSKTLENIALKIKSNKRAFLYRFYLNCFSSFDSDALLWFKNNLMQDYLDNFPEQNLLCGLGYLRQASIKLQQLSLNFRVKIFHGEQDKIAPIGDIFKLKPLLPKLDFVNLRQAGHMVFLNPEFRNNF